LRFVVFFVRRFMQSKSRCVSFLGLLYTFSVSAQSRTTLRDHQPRILPISNPRGNWKLVVTSYDLNAPVAGSTKTGTGVLVNDPSGKSKDQHGARRSGHRPGF
jgi:hypothetical protein